MIGRCLLRLALGLPTGSQGGVVNNGPFTWQELDGTKLVEHARSILQDGSQTATERRLDRVYMKL